MAKNNFKIQGVLYAKDLMVIKGKKDPTKEYPKYTITLEVKSAGERNIGGQDKYITTTQLPQFEIFNPRFDMNSYYIGDEIEINFYLEGKEYVRKKGEQAGEKAIMSKNVIIDMKHADKQVNKTAKDSKLSFDNKIPVTAMSDIDKIGEPPEDDPFPEVKTNMVKPKIDVDDDDSDGLPF